MGNKPSVKDIRVDDFIKEQLKRFRFSSSDIMNSQSIVNNNQKYQPITFNLVDNDKLYSILNLSHQIALEHLHKHEYKSNESIYTSTLFYQCKDKNKDTNSNLRKGSLKYKCTKSNTFKSHLSNRHDDSKMTLNSPHKSTRSLFMDESHINDTRSQLQRFGSNKFYSSCEDFKMKEKKNRVNQENRSDDFFQKRDDCLSISKEYKMNNIPIQEENERSFSCNKHNQSKTHFQWGKRSSLKSCRTYDEYNKSRSGVIDYSKQVRDKCFKLFSKGKGVNENNNDLNNTFADIKKQHNASLMNYLYENLNDSKSNNTREKYMGNKNKYKLTHNKRYSNESNPIFKINIKSLSKLPMKINKNIAKTQQSLKSKRKSNPNYYLTSLNNKNSFVSTLEHFIEVNPHNRSQTIKSIIKQKKEEQQKMTKVMDRYNKEHLQTKETLLDNSLSSQLIFKNDDSECSYCSKNNEPDKNVLLLCDQLDEATNLSQWQYQRLSSIKPLRNHI